jgi:hypothetical protein
MDDGVQQQALGVYQEVALLAFDLLAAIESKAIPSIQGVPGWTLT